MQDSINFQFFNSQASNYDVKNAYLLAQIACKTYREEKETNDRWRERTKEEAKLWGFEPEHVYCFNNKGSQAILLADTEKIILGFRGSEEKDDWRINFNRLKDSKFKKRLGMCVHGGFLKYVSQIWEPYEDSKKRPEAKGIKAILHEEIKDKKKCLWLTGHSLGGAAAIIAAATCLLEDPPLEISGVYTYGQPRVGDRKFVEWFNSQVKSKTFRFVNNNDIVTKIPTWAPYFFFSHVGQMKYLTEDGEILDLEKLNWLVWLKNMFSGVINDISENGIDAITDHSMISGYIPPLNKALLM